MSNMNTNENSIDVSNVVRTNMNKKNARFRMLRSTSIEIESVPHLDDFHP